MSSWPLLLVTAGCGFLTYDAFRWIGGVERGPFSTIAKLWRSDLSHLSLAEKQNIKSRYVSLLSGCGWMPWALLVTTVALGVFTLQSFLAA